MGLSERAGVCLFDRSIDASRFFGRICADIHVNGKGRYFALLGVTGSSMCACGILA